MWDLYLRTLGALEGNSPGIWFLLEREFKSPVEFCVGESPVGQAAWPTVEERQLRGWVGDPGQLGHGYVCCLGLFPFKILYFMCLCI